MPQQFRDEVLYDVRLLDRHIRRGLLTRDAVDKRHEASTDLTDQCDKLDLDHLSRHVTGKKQKV